MPSRLLRALAFACAALAACASSCLAAPRVFRAKAAAQVHSHEPQAAFPAGRRLSVRRAKRAYLRFDVTVPAGQVVTSALLRLYPLSRGGERGIAVRGASPADWKPGTITRRRAPQLGPTVARARRYPRGHWLRLNVTRLVQGPGPVSVALVSRALANHVFAGSADRARAPRLFVTTTPPATPQSSRPGAAVPPVAPADPQPLPVGDLPGWRQVFTDDFDTPVPLGSFPAAVSDRWGAYDNTSHDTTGRGRYYPEKVLSVSDGKLNMFLHTENGEHLVAAPYPKVTPTAPYGQLYGRYAVRFRADPLKGYKTAWLLWPDSGNWPFDGEIDFPEQDLDQTMMGFVHHQGATAVDDHDWFQTNTPYGAWHTAVIEWSPGKVVFSLDGREIGETTNRIPDTPMHWVLQTETGLTSAPDDTTQGYIQIDWVAVWARA